MSLEIPNYRIIEQLGIGAGTTIYRARCMSSGRDYSVKIVKITKPEDTNLIELLRAEHAIASSLDHAVIRKVYELRILRRRLRLRGAILFMEYVDGITMSSKSFNRSLLELLGLFAQVAEGLQAMHLAGYVHADLKPSNILVCSNDSVKLIDFGQSSKIHGAKPRIQGTIDYIAPEQVQRGVLDARTDVFGLGAALHRVVTGQPVATEMNQTVTVYSQGLVGKRIDKDRPPATEGLPVVVARLINDCCQYSPNDRIPDMPALLERIMLARTILAKRSRQSAGKKSGAGSAEGDESEVDRGIESKQAGPDAAGLD